jgi:lysophospholipase L1-like esterase
LLLLVMPALAVECGMRVYFATQVGPSVLWYGTPLASREIDPLPEKGQQLDHTVMYHENELGSYSKYFAHEKRVDHDVVSGEVFDVTINNRGFRGDDFMDEKPPGVVRVVCLGGSSTFGYHDRDDETYPHHLEETLNRRAHRRTSEHGVASPAFEVLNLGIPHLRSEQILSLFLAEALPLQPDVVTFYEGVNDAAREERASAPESAPADEEDRPTNLRGRLSRLSAVRSVYRALRRRLVFVRFADTLLVHPARTWSQQELEAHARGKSEFFLSNLDLVHFECERRGILFIVANQQAQSLLLEREEIRGVTYREESGLVRAKLEREKYIDFPELCFLTHNQLMTDLESWAREREVPFVDIIRLLDATRDVLVSWVHLSPEGNRKIAAAFADEIVGRLPVNRF